MNRRCSRETEVENTVVESLAIESGRDMHRHENSPLVRCFQQNTSKIWEGGEGGLEKKKKNNSMNSLFNLKRHTN